MTPGSPAVRGHRDLPLPTPQEAAPSGPCWLALGGQPCCPHRGRPRPHPVPRPSPGLKARPAPRPPCDRPLPGAPGPRWCPDCPAPRAAVKTPVQRPEADLHGGARAPSRRPSACVAVCPPHGLHGAATPTGKDGAGRGRDPGGSRPCPANTSGGPKTGRQGGWGRAGVPVPPGPGARSRLRGDPRGLGGGPRLRARPSLRPPSTGSLCSRPPCRPRTDRDPSPARPRRPPRWAPVHCQAPHRASPGGQPAPPRPAMRKWAPGRGFSWAAASGRGRGRPRVCASAGDPLRASSVPGHAQLARTFVW